MRFHPRLWKATHHWPNHRAERLLTPNPSLKLLHKSRRGTALPGLPISCKQALETFFILIIPPASRSAEEEMASARNRSAGTRIVGPVHPTRVKTSPCFLAPRVVPCPGAEGVSHRGSVPHGQRVTGGSRWWELIVNWDPSSDRSAGKPIRRGV